MIVLKNSFKYNKYLLIVYIYFFFNNLFLPHGLLYTILLTPVFYYYSIKNKAKNIVFYFILIFSPYAIFHVLNGAVPFYYARSIVLAFAVFIFGVAFHIFLKKNKVETFFPSILKLNFAFLIVALLFFYTPLNEVFWTFKNLNPQIKDFPRLELLTYEPSYYSLLLAPIALYYFVKFLLIPIPWKNLIVYGFTIALPLLLSFSLGVISSIAISILLVILFNLRGLIKKRKIFFTLYFITLATVTGLLLLLIVYPENPLYARIIDIIQGKDTSASGRTTNAFHLAELIANRKSSWFGVGFGQIKVVGTMIIRDFYNYDLKEIGLFTIPNAVGETFAMFGISGLIIRLGLQIVLFFKTKVYNNYYRLAVFLFVFIYQFTGSFFTNTAELVMWVIAFTSCCKQFNKENLNSASAPRNSASPLKVYKP